MPQKIDAAFLDAIRMLAYPLTGNSNDYDPLLELIGDSRFVLLGGASQGTHEFHRERAEITKRLIMEKGFTAVAVDDDWPDAYRVNRYVRGASHDSSAGEALTAFRRFPAWIWRNAPVVEFVEWLRDHNEALLPGAAMAGFYGLDLYRLHASIQMTLRYLEKVNTQAATQVLMRYARLDHFREDDPVYGLMTGSDITRSNTDEIVMRLLELQRYALESAQREGRSIAADEAFFAEREAHILKNAERYYRLMFLEEVSTWTLRDRHMTETLGALAEHLGSPNRPAKVVVWAHNSHVGDARATDMGLRGELNMGEIAHLWYGYEAVLVGFTTYHGRVTAASAWGKSAERKWVRPAPPGSYEEVLHRTELNRFLLTWRHGDRGTEGLLEPRIERAVGAIYRPESERKSDYFQARLPNQFDAVLHFDETAAVKPLELEGKWENSEAPATFPFAV